MHESLGGISLLEHDDYVTVLGVLLSFSLELSSGHSIDSDQINDFDGNEKLPEPEEDFTLENISEEDDSHSIKSLNRQFATLKEQIRLLELS